MQTKLAEWNERAKSAANYREKLRLVEEIELSREAPEYLRTAATRSKQSLSRYIDGGMLDSTDKHSADHHFQSFKFAFP
ncbi:hypothetical protein LJR030_000509 [Rhizobium sp. LjRoot30]|uniref:hypothetical protein n=1 Tax=Rhizobium sp. LjRoot30 TaxID=3342320 RepID=UPI003ECF93BC